MRRSPQPYSPSVDLDIAGLHADGQSLICSRCKYPLECVEQSRRAGSWLGSLLCPNCRNEYLYAYRWGRLMRKN
jgi:hypothetical protein